MTASGRDVAAAISSTSSAEVLVARIAPGLAMRSSRPNTSFLTSMFSNTASITRSASASFSISSVGVSSAMRRSMSAAVMRPFFAVFS